MQGSGNPEFRIVRKEEDGPEEAPPAAAAEGGSGGGDKLEAIDRRLAERRRCGGCTLLALPCTALPAWWRAVCGRGCRRGGAQAVSQASRGEGGA